VLFENPKEQDPNLRSEHVLNVVPKRISVNLNTYREADTFKLELDYKCFPFDPRLIRSLGVTVHIRDMGSLYDKAGQTQKLAAADDDAIFQGFADEETMTFDDSNRTVSFEGRDFTALFLDSPYPEGTVNMEKPLDQVLTKIVQSRVDTAQIKVVNRTGLTRLPTIASFYPDFGGTKLGGKKNVSRGETYWEVIQDLINRAALIGYIELDKLVLAKPQNLYAGAQPYQFIYGKNLTNLSFKRKLSKQKGFNVRVRSINPEAKTAEGRVLTKDIPREATTAWLQKVGLPPGLNAVIKKPVAAGTEKEGSTTKEETAPFLAFNVPNVRNSEQLVAIGEGIYEDLGRQQIEGDLETREMAILRTVPGTTGPVEFDIRKIRTATPIKLELAEDELEQTRAISGDGRDAQGRRMAYLMSRNYPQKVAQALATSLGKYPTTFYTKAAEFTLDAENGFSMKLEFVNFIDLKSRGL
jgi:hypothetical protein